MKNKAEKQKAYRIYNIVFSYNTIVRSYNKIIVGNAMLLKEYLIKNKIPVKQFGEALNLSRPHMYAILRGAKKPSLELAVLIENLTGSEVKPRDFLETPSKGYLSIC